MAPENKMFKIVREEEYTDPIYLKLDLQNKDTKTAFLDIYMYYQDNISFVIRFYPVNVIDNRDPKAAYYFIKDTTLSAVNFIKSKYNSSSNKYLEDIRKERISKTISYILSKVSDIIKRNGQLSELGI